MGIGESIKMDVSNSLVVMDRRVHKIYMKTCPTYLNKSMSFYIILENIMRYF